MTNEEEEHESKKDSNEQGTPHKSEEEEQTKTDLTPGDSKKLRKIDTTRPCRTDNTAD